MMNMYISLARCSILTNVPKEPYRVNHVNVDYHKMSKYTTDYVEWDDQDLKWIYRLNK